MKKKIKIEELCCANCAAKIEAHINKLDGVNKANVNFIMENIVIDGEEDKMDNIIEQVVAICHKIEPDAKVIV